MNLDKATFENRTDERIDKLGEKTLMMSARYTDGDYRLDIHWFYDENQGSAKMRACFYSGLQQTYFPMKGLGAWFDYTRHTGRRRAAKFFLNRVPRTYLV